MAQISDYETLTEISYEHLLLLAKSEKTYAISYEDLKKCLSQGKLSAEQGSLNAGRVLVIGENGIIRPLGEVLLKEKNITQNGTYNPVDEDVDGYNLVTVSVPVVSSVGSAIISHNGTYEARGFGFDAFSKVVVDVPNTIVTGSKTITENGTYVASSDFYDGYSAVTVSISRSTSTVTCSSNYTYNAADYGCDAFSVVTVDVDKGTLMSQKVITSNGRYDASDDGYDGYKNVKVDVVNLESFITGTFSGSYINDNLSQLQVAAFAYCNVEYVDIQHCRAIPFSAFYSCKSLRFARITRCSYIGENAFYGCSILSYVLTNSCSSIYGSAFAYARSLTKLILDTGSVCSLAGSGVFYGTPIMSSISGVYGSIYVRSSMVDAYRNDSVWSFFSDRIVAW